MNHLLKKKFFQKVFITGRKKRFRRLQFFQFRINRALNHLNFPMRFVNFENKNLQSFGKYVTQYTCRFKKQQKISKKGGYREKDLLIFVDVLTLLKNCFHREKQ